MPCAEARKLGSDDVIHSLSGLLCSKGKPEYIRSDNGAEFTSKALRLLLKRDNQWYKDRGQIRIF